LISIKSIPSLNGLRAASVLLVFAAHAGLGHLVPGGFGVTVFFFLSGFLITSLLLDEQNRNGRIALKQFFIRRFTRLFPPLAVSLIAIYLLTFLSISPGGISWVGALSQIFYFANYHGIFFASSGDIPRGTGILWSLAVEEHFYFFYPLLLFLGFRYLNLKQIGYLVAFACLLILGWRIMLVSVYEAPPLRTYYATDTRIDSIFFGCLLAVFNNPLKSKTTNYKSIDMFEAFIIAASIILLLFTFLYRDSFFRETFRYTIQGLALMPLFYYAIVKHESILFCWLNFSIVEFIGLISYSFYLIHFVIIHTLNYQLTEKINGLLLAFISLLLTIALSSLIYATVEIPMKNFRKLFRC